MQLPDARQFPRVERPGIGLESSNRLLMALLSLWWLFAALALALFLRSNVGKGWVGESVVRLNARFRLDKGTYHRFHNVTLFTPDGTTQIDHVLVSRFGVFVIETKNMQGWIFGRQSDAWWTQSIYFNKRRFQNPLRQNFKHVKALESVLAVPAQTLHSVVAFVGSATLKTELPRNVTQGAGFVSYVQSFTEPVFDDQEIDRLVAALKAGRLAPTAATHRAHVQALKRRDDPAAAELCPKCGSALVLRTAMRGEGSGKRFWGCSAFPSCRYTRPSTGAA